MYWQKLAMQRGRGQCALCNVYILVAAAGVAVAVRWAGGLFEARDTRIARIELLRDTNFSLELKADPFFFRGAPPETAEGYGGPEGTIR